MINWIKVEDCLPPDGKNVLLLIEAYGFLHEDPLGNKKGRWIFLGYFNRRFGWHVPYIQQKSYAVIGWIPSPEIEI